jgi:hypothetical protein
VGESWIPEALCRQRPVMWPTVGYTKLCVGRTRTLANNWSHEVVCRQRPALWVRVGYMKLRVDRDLNCG